MVSRIQTGHIHHAPDVIRQGRPGPGAPGRIEQLQLHLTRIGTQQLVIACIGRIGLYHGHPHRIHRSAPVDIGIGVQDGVKTLPYGTGIESPHGVGDACPCPRSSRRESRRQYLFESLVAIRWTGCDQVQFGQLKHIGYPRVTAGATGGIGREHRNGKHTFHRLQHERHIPISARQSLPFEIGPLRLCGRKSEGVPHTS